MSEPFDMTDSRQVALATLFGHPSMLGAEMADRFLLPLFSASIHYRLLPPSLPVNIDLQGVTEVREALVGLVGTLKQIEWWAERVVAGSTDIVVFAHSRGILLNDEPYTNSYAIRFAFNADGLLTEMDEFVDSGSVAKMIESLSSVEPTT